VLLKSIFFFKLAQITFLLYSLYNPYTHKIISTFFLLGSLGSIFYGSFAAFFEDKLKKIIAFSSINQIGFSILGFINTGTTVVPTEMQALTNYYDGINLSVFVFIIYLLNTNLMFLSININFDLNKKTNEKDFIYLKTLIHKPITKSIPFIIAFLSFSGIPPLAGFFPKIFMLTHI
jgi:NADH:ubiquinone oxidoreductase subunit 2 (subunit N)